MTIEATNTDEGQGGAAAEGVAATEQAQGTSPEAASAAAADAASLRPEGLPDQYWDAATNTVKTGDVWSALRDMQAQQADRAANVPGEGEAYDLALPQGFEKPADIDIEFKADDPLWADFQSIAKAEGVTKDAFGKFVGAFAKYQIASHEADIAAYVSEKTALGANADARIKAGETWLKGNLSTAQAEALGGALLTKAGVEALEAIIRIKSGPAAATNAGASSVPEKTSTAESWYPQTQPGAR